MEERARERKAARDKNNGVYNGDGISMVLGEGQKPGGVRCELLHIYALLKGPRTDQQDKTNVLIW